MTSALNYLPDYVDLQDPRTRDDLRAIPAAEAAGWKVTFRNDNWHNAAAFTRDDITVWMVCRRQTLGWQRAKLVNNRYTAHEMRPSLVDALGLASLTP